MSGQSYPRLWPLKCYKGGRGIHMDIKKGVNDGNIQAMGTSHYFIVIQVAVLGVTGHRVFKKPMPCPHEYKHFKFLWTGFHILHWICKNYGIQIPLIRRSHHQYLPFLQTQSGGGWGVKGHRTPASHFAN